LPPQEKRITLGGLLPRPRLPAMNVELRRATSADEGFLRQLHSDAMRSHVEEAWGLWDPDEQAKHFSKAPVRDHEIVLLDRRTVGCLLVVREIEEYVLSRIWIVPGEQGRGLGTHLVRQLCERALHEGHGVRLRVLRLNRAHRLYARLGFVVVTATETHFTMKRIA
jgi:GNAT superfamily N-acetyltransferase